MDRSPDGVAVLLLSVRILAQPPSASGERRAAHTARDRLTRIPGRTHVR
jgi:hypothetical protein